MTRVRLMLVRDRRRKAITINGPADVFALLRKEARGLDREVFWRVDLDSRNTVLAYETVSIGTVSAALVHCREVFKGALLANASAVVVCHFHPSQDTSSSPEDKEVTTRLKRAGDLLGIPLHDHVVLCDSAYYSFREHGLL